jgi:hypothetical protein
MPYYITEGRRLTPGLQDDPESDVELLRQLIDRGDVATIHEMVKFWKAVKAFGMFAGFVRRTVIGAAALLVAWLALNEALINGLKQWLGLHR